MAEGSSSLKGDGARVHSAAGVVHLRVGQLGAPLRERPRRGPWGLARGGGGAGVETMASAGAETNFF